MVITRSARAAAKVKRIGERHTLCSGGLQRNNTIARETAVPAGGGEKMTEKKTIASFFVDGELVAIIGSFSDDS